MGSVFMTHLTCVFCLEPLHCAENKYKPWTNRYSCNFCRNPILLSRCIFTSNNDKITNRILCFPNDIMLTINPGNFQLYEMTKSKFNKLILVNQDFPYQHDFKYLMRKIQTYLTFL